jgi:TolA-binding protein
MAKVKITGDKSRAAGTSVPAAPVKPPANPVVMIIALIGWILAAVALFGAISANSTQQAVLQEIQDSLPEKMAAMQAEVNAKTRTFNTSGQETATKIEEKNTTISELFTEVQELEIEANKLSEERAALEKKLTETKQLKAANEAALAETQKQLEETTAQLIKISNKKDKAKAYYRKHYAALESKLRDLVDSGGGNQVKHFFYTYSHTPFGPAAGFHAGDKLYKERASADARKVFERVARQYPGSSYSGAAKDRLEELNARVPYADASSPPGISAYNALQFGD